MVDLEFVDFVESKYSYVKEFSEGLAAVRDRNNLWGYIDKTGKEVIPCQFTEAEYFSEGLAAVSNSEGKFGFIDKEGNLKIPYQFKETKRFREGLAAVNNDDDHWGYINSDGELVISFKYKGAWSFCEDVAIVELFDTNTTFAHVDKNGEILFYADWIECFYNGQAVAVTKNQIFAVDKQYNKIKFFDWPGVTFGYFCNGYRTLETNNKRYGYTDYDFNIKIPAIFKKANNFEHGAAIVEADDETIGFITDSNKMVWFSKNTQYEEIKDFSEGLAAVKNTDGLWGFIDKTGKEVIKCQYQAVDSFSEGLAGVIDVHGNYFFINKRGTKKIIIPSIYKSAIDAGDKIITITAETEKELCEKKLEVLSLLQDEYIEKIKQDIQNCSTDIEMNLYDISTNKKKKKTQQNKKVS